MEDGAELIARIAAGDRGAFSRFFREYAGRVYRCALTLVHNRAPAEEVVQETMLAVWKGAGTFRGDARPSTWVLGIAALMGCPEGTVKSRIFYAKEQMKEVLEEER